MITFKPLHRDDFTLLQRWLNIDFVSKWYERRKFIYDDVERKYLSNLPADTPVDSFIIRYNEISIGYIHTYPVGAYPEYSACIEVHPDTAGLDFFIGDRDYIFKGLGKDIVSLFLRDIVFTKHGVSQCVVGPEPKNAAAIRVYGKAGFTYLKTVQCNHEKEQEYLMSARKKPEEHLVYPGG